MVLVRLEEDLSKTTINTWFDDTSAVALEVDTLLLHCPNDFKRSNIQDRFLPNIQEKLKDIFSSDIQVKLLSDEELLLHQKKDDKKPVSMMDSNEYTFDTFIVGPSNRLACSAAKAVADAPGQSYNPLFIYGNSGLGKTHLLYAIAHVIRATHPSDRIIYIKGDDFINDFVEAVRTGKAGDFRIKYREADLFLVDDIQFVAGKVETQNEFFHTFNTLFESKKQIVLTSDRPPSEMAQLDDRLRTRFEWGLITDVQRPDLETRIAIIKNKALQLGLVFDDATSTYIAERITSNVRQLEGTVKKLKAQHDLEKKEITRELVDKTIQDMIRSDEFKITPDSIITEVCRYFQLEGSQIRGQSRNRDYVNARQIAMYLIQEMTELPLKKIGQSFDNRDHSTVLHSINQVKRQIKNDFDFAETIKAIKTNINSKE